MAKKENNVRQVKLPEVHTGELMTEVVRAFLHGGAPSAMVSRLIKGVDEFIAQSGVTEDINLMEGMRSDLIVLRAAWRKKEDEHHA